MTSAPYHRLAWRAAQASILFVLVVSGRGVEAVADTQAPVNTVQEARDAIRFGDFLLSTGESSRAVGEYFRAYWVARQDSSGVRLDALNGVGRAQLAAGDYEAVIGLRRGSLASQFGACEVGDLDVLAATAALRLGQVDIASSFLLQQRASGCRPSTLVPGRIEILSGITAAHAENWSEAAQWFSSVPPESPSAGTAAAYSRLAVQGSLLSTKDPKRAALLGIVPGGGYFYAGYRQTAVAALLVNLVFAEAAREAFRHDQPTLGGFLSVFGLSWYAGSIYGSYHSAIRRNHWQRESVLSQFEY